MLTDKDNTVEKVASERRSGATSLSQIEIEEINALFQKSDYSNNKMSVEIDEDVFELARCLCFIKPSIPPQELLENALRKAMVDIATPFAKEVKSIFKRNPYDKLVKYIKRGGGR